MRVFFACALSLLATAAQAQVVTYTARRAVLACRSHEMLARANDVLQYGDGEAWAKFAAVTVFSGDCIVIPAGASVVGALEDFWGRTLRIHRNDDEASYLADPDEFILVSGDLSPTP
jgi:hypothetical protein